MKFKQGGKYVGDYTPCGHDSHLGVPVRDVEFNLLGGEVTKEGFISWKWVVTKMGRETLVKVLGRILVDTEGLCGGEFETDGGELGYGCEFSNMRRAV